MLFAICLAFLILASVYAWLIPPLEGFDATAHYLASVYYREHFSPPPLEDATVQYSFELVTQPPLYHALAAVAGLGWPTGDSKTYAESIRNPYFGGQSKRQTITTPDAPFRLVAPIWLARLVSMLGGLLTVLAAWVFVSSHFPRARGLIMASTALVAFNPQFLFMSATVTNDAWAAATIAWTLALASRAVTQNRSARYWIWPGIAGGLAVVTKYSGFIAGIPALSLLIALAYRTSVSKAMRSARYALVGGALVAGAWYLRMLIVYGEVVPFDAMSAAIPALYRDPPYTLQHTLEHLPWLRASYWGVFVANIAPTSYLEFTRIFMWIGSVGVILFLVRRWSDVYDGKRLAVITAGVWVGVVAYSVLNWTRTVAYGEQGRLAHIAAPALAFLLAAGWQGFVPEKWVHAMHVGLTVTALALGLSQTVTLHRAYAMPKSLEVGAVAFDRAVDTGFDGGMRLVGADLPQGAALEPGTPMPMTLYFTADAPIDDFYTLFIHLADGDNNLLFQHDGPPVKGRHPTKQWRQGEVFADQVEILVDEIPADGLAQLSLGFYPFERTSERVQVFDAEGAPIGDRLLLADVRLHADRQDADRQDAADGDALAGWENGIELLEASLDFDDRSQPQSVSLTWRSNAVLHEDLTAFVQALDADGAVIAQADRQPQDGDWPTSTWRSGDTIYDEFPLLWAADADAADWRNVIVGWYAQDGVRPLLVEPAPGKSYYELANNGHDE